MLQEKAGLECGSRNQGWREGRSLQILTGAGWNLCHEPHIQPWSPGLAKASPSSRTAPCPPAVTPGPGFRSLQEDWAAQAAFIQLLNQQSFERGDKPFKTLCNTSHWQQLRDPRASSPPEPAPHTLGKVQSSLKGHRVLPKAANGWWLLKGVLQSFPEGIGLDKQPLPMTGDKGTQVTRNQQILPPGKG